MRRRPPGSEKEVLKQSGYVREVIREALFNNEHSIDVLNKIRGNIRKSLYPYRKQARKNHLRWKKNPHIHPSEKDFEASDKSPEVAVIAADWGEVAQQRSKATGEIYAVLCAVDPDSPGSGYEEDISTQDANMQKRSTAVIAADRRKNKGGYS